MRAPSEWVSAIARDLGARHGVDVEDVQVRQLGRRTAITVTIDCEAGVDSDTSALMARGLREALTADSAFRDVDFVLEVSSPGVGRLLETPRRWRRNIGRLVDVDQGDLTLTGRVVAVDDDGVEIRLVGGAQERIAFADIDRAVVRVEFARHEEGR